MQKVEAPGHPEHSPPFASQILICQVLLDLFLSNSAVNSKKTVILTCPCVVFLLLVSRLIHTGCFLKKPVAEQRVIGLHVGKPNKVPRSVFVKKKKGKMADA